MNLLKSYTEQISSVSKVKTLKMPVQVSGRTGTKIVTKRFGLLKQNRPIAKPNVNNFTQIIASGKYYEDFPIITTEASDLIKAGYELIDLGGNVIDAKDAYEYLIVLDGQHRVSAFYQLNEQKLKSEKIIIPNVKIKKIEGNVGEYLASINTAGHSWTKADTICVSAIITENPILTMINKLIKEGFNATTAVMICLGKRLTASQLKKLMSKKDTSFLPKNEDEQKALKRANKFYTTCMKITGMNVKMLTKRYFITGFNSFATSISDDVAFKALEQLIITDFESIRESDELVAKLKEAKELLDAQVA